MVGRWIGPAGGRVRVGGLTAAAVCCVLLALALRLPFVAGPLESDEAGLLMVARQWHDGGPHLYGGYWLDRPPLLPAYFAAADALAGGTGVRLLGCAVAALLVLAGVLAGHALAGSAGAWVAGLLAAALGSSYLIAGHMLNGPLQAAALVMAGSACLLLALRTSAAVTQWLLGAASGALAAAAVLVRQNAVDAMVFGGVLLTLLWVGRPARRRTVLRVLTGGMFGLLAVGGGLAAWAATGPVTGDLWFVLYEFRARALGTITERRPVGPTGRLLTLVLAGLGSGVLACVVGYLAAARGLLRDPAHRAVAAATLAMLAVGVLGVALGGSWWRHYWVQLVPVCVLAAAQVAGGRTRSGRWMRWVTGFAVASAVAATGVGLAVQQAAPPDQTTVGRWLRGPAEPGDTGLVLYGNPEILYAAGLDCPCPHLWSLPLRTLDPGLRQLTGIVAGPDGPAWVVAWNPVGSWGLDPSGRFAAALDRRYRVVARPCGREVLLRRGLDREVPPAPECG